MVLGYLIQSSPVWGKIVPLFHLQKSPPIGDYGLFRLIRPGPAPLALEERAEELILENVEKRMGALGDGEKISEVRQNTTATFKLGPTSSA